jgi:hypothetical protein
MLLRGAVYEFRHRWTNSRREIIERLWASGEASVRSVMEALNERASKPRASYMTRRQKRLQLARARARPGHARSRPTPVGHLSAGLPGGEDAVVVVEDALGVSGMDDGLGAGGGIVEADVGPRVGCPSDDRGDINGGDPIGYRPQAVREARGRMGKVGMARSANFSGPMTASNMWRAWFDVSGMKSLLVGLRGTIVEVGPIVNICGAAFDATPSRPARPARPRHRLRLTRSGRVERPTAWSLT